MDKLNLALKTKDCIMLILMGEKMPKPKKIDPTEPSRDIPLEEVEKNIEKLSPEDREKLGWGLSTIGFKVEKAKNDLFAATLNKSLAKIDKKGTAGRFFTELRDSFAKDSENARKKGVDIQEGKDKARLKNLSFLSGNILRYGRMITDLTGASLASPLRYVMMGGMATTRLAEAGKEARLKNEDVIEKTRIQDVEKAHEEALKIYERAKIKEKTENVSAEALKNAYMMEMPKDIIKRLENPSTGNTFIQKIIKEDIGIGLMFLIYKIQEVEENSKLSPEQKEKEIEKIITKQKKNLEDYDRIITQYGTVDGLAMAGRYAQTAGKAVVAVVTVETLYLSAEKLWGTISHILTSHDVQTNGTSGKIVKSILKTNEKPKIPTPPSAPSPVINNFTNDGIKFEKGKGGIQGILDLKKQIADQYKGDYSKAPESVRDFMNTDATKEAIKLGLFDPNNPEGKESALIATGSVLKFDEQGNLLFGTPDDTGKIPPLDKNNWKMFDSDQNAKVSKISTTEPATKTASEEEVKQKIDELRKKIDIDTKKTTPTPETTEISKEPTTHEMLKKIIEEKKQKIAEQIDKGPEKTNVAEPLIKKPGLGYQTVGVGTKFSTGSEVSMGTPVSTGSTVGTGEVFAGGNYPGNQQPIIFNRETYYPDSNGQYHGMFSHKPYFPEITPEENVILQQHPEFLKNPFSLSGEKLMQVYEIHQSNISHIFPKDTRDVWDAVSRGPAKEMLSTKKTEAEEGLSPFISYLHKLKEITGLKPKGGFIFRDETNGEYVTRALQKAASLGKLEELKTSLRK